MKKLKHTCKTCGIKVGKTHIYCSKHRICKECGITKVGKGISYCDSCKVIKTKRRNELRRIEQRKYLICGKDGCKEERVYMKQRCEYHSKENTDKRYQEEIKNCSDCGCEIGKRKDTPYKKYCDNCLKIKTRKRKERQRIYQNQYYKDRYNNDEVYRKKNLEYQKKYKKKNKTK